MFRTYIPVWCKLVRFGNSHTNVLTSSVDACHVVSDRLSALVVENGLTAKITSRSIRKIRPTSLYIILRATRQMHYNFTRKRPTGHSNGDGTGVNSGIGV